MRGPRMPVLLGTVVLCLVAAAPAMAAKTISLYSEGTPVGNTTVESNLSFTFTIPYAATTATCSDKLSGLVSGDGLATVTVHHSLTESHAPGVCTAGSLEVTEDTSEMTWKGKAKQGWHGNFTLGPCSFKVTKSGSGTVSLNTTADDKSGGKLLRGTVEEPRQCAMGATWTSATTFNLPGSGALLEDQVG
jgi:hypothetical protein